MRKKNSICEFSSERSEALIRSFRESLARQSVISLKRAFQDAVDAPAPRFWVSEARAVRVITRMIKGIDLTEGMLPEKRKMYMEIYRRTMEFKRLHPDVSLGDIIFEIINNEAPSSYMSVRQAQRIIRKR